MQYQENGRSHCENRPSETQKTKKIEMTGACDDMFKFPH